MEQHWYQAYFDHGYGSRSYSEYIYEDENQCYEEAENEFSGYSGGEIHVTWVYLKPKKD